jgi:hypothetical protein
MLVLICEYKIYDLETKIEKGEWTTTNKQI